MLRTLVRHTLSVDCGGTDIEADGLEAGGNQEFRMGSLGVDDCNVALNDEPKLYNRSRRLSSRY